METKSQIEEQYLPVERMNWFEMYTVFMWFCGSINNTLQRGKSDAKETKYKGLDAICLVFAMTKAL